MLLKKDSDLTILTVVLFWGRGEGHNLPVDFRQRLRVFQSDPDYVLIRVRAWKETHSLDTRNDSATVSNTTPDGIPKMAFLQ